jgi:hypothetical protein
LNTSSSFFKIPSNPTTNNKSLFFILDGIWKILTPSATNTPIIVEIILFNPNTHTTPNVPKSKELINAFGLTVTDKNVNIETNIAYLFVCLLSIVEV